MPVTEGRPHAAGAAPGVAVDLATPIRIHVVGIGGTGMSAIATVLIGMGHTVSGSDVAETAVVERLRELGATVRIGHDVTAVDDADVVTSSSAVPTDNIELAAAARRRVPVLTRAEILAAVCATRRTLAVSGTHGKTTTSSMLFSILSEAGWHPSCVIGGDLHGLGWGAVWDTAGEWLVVEADESDGTFLELPAEGVVVTNVESDHLEFYGDLDALRAAFAGFLGGGGRARVANADDPGADLITTAVRSGRPGAERTAESPWAGTASAPPQRPPAVTTFGAAAGSSLLLSAIELRRDGASFAVSLDGRSLGSVDLAVPGLHNVYNAAGALALALRSGVAFDVAATALRGFREVARRFQWRGEGGGVSYIDDYGHLPAEVKAVLATARTGGWGRVVAVFQPHRYSRTQRLHADFADAFVDADVLVLTDVYPAGEAPRPGVNGALIHQAVTNAHPDADVRYVEHRQDLAGALRRLLRPGDLCLTLGAGNLNALPAELLGAELLGAGLPDAGLPDAGLPDDGLSRAEAGPDGSAP
jgi:UDP-N-acetylmuramate--alanine ligase